MSVRESLGALLGSVPEGASTCPLCGSFYRYELDPDRRTGRAVGCTPERCSVYSTTTSTAVTKGDTE